MDKKSVLISGGTNGIGKGAVLQLLEDGFNVATFSRNKDKIDSLQKELGEQYSQKQFLVLQADVNNEKELSVAVKKTIETFGAVDILINNAGIGYFADCDDVDMSRFQQMLQTNIVGLALLTKLVVPQMKQQKEGLIINLASISGKIAFANGEFYSATKFGVMGYSQGIRSELKDFGIKVATLCPGMIKTDFFDEEELERRKKVWHGKIPQMLDVKDINRIISLICNQSKHCDIQDLTVMPF
ncbi:MAG: SDR family oxidoreductase [Candidatus Peribacteria bacterium]|nr:MAG: SDR family oxidoreductase [Candidatus Peribacteria bacterium]USN58925.1 MAG: SDR family oxidoreductase [Candidatus Peribacteria bacterium]